MRNLRILFTSDTHGYLMPTDYGSTQEKEMGLFKLENAFLRDGNTLIIDGGDTIQGSPFTNYTSRLDIRPHPCAQALNLGGYQYVTLGNHDFNMGIEHLNTYLSDLNAICLCANIRDRAGRLPIRPWAIHMLENGLRVGLVGACTHYVERWEKPETLALLEIEEPIPSIRRALAEIKPLCDVTVLIYHGGFECDLESGKALTASNENQGYAICREMDFDLLLAGHQHMPIAGVDICGTYAVEPAYRAVHFLQVDMEIGDGKKYIQSSLMPPAEKPLAAGMEAVEKLEAEVQSWLDTPAGHLDMPLLAGEPLSNALNGCAIANFVNTVQLEASGADVSACSLANSFKGMEQNVAIRDVVSSYVYSNTLKVLRMTGATLRQYIERTAEYFSVVDEKVAISESFLRPKVEHYNYDYFSGMDYTIDLRKPVGHRVSSMSRAGKEIGLDDEVSVCINNYRATGAGGYDMIPGLPLIKDIQEDVADLIIEFIERKKHIEVDKHPYLKVILP